MPEKDQLAVYHKIVNERLPEYIDQMGYGEMAEDGWAYLYQKVDDDLFKLRESVIWMGGFEKDNKQPPPFEAFRKKGEYYILRYGLTRSTNISGQIG